MPKVCLDAGHGGSAPGACGKFSKEKDITLALVLNLGAKLQKCGVDVVYTRTSDIFLSLEQRCNISDKANADWFLSIHCDSWSTEVPTGCSAFYAPRSDIGANFATMLQNAMLAVNRGNNRGVKTCDFYVVLHTDAPACLVETEFISNPEKERMLNDPAWQEAFTTNLAIEMTRFFGMNASPLTGGAAPIAANPVIPQVNIEDPVLWTPPASAESIRIIPLEGGIGWLEIILSEKRMVYHLNRAVYMSFKATGEIEAYSYGGRSARVI
jgi:N-acetylmuramoyl-L-alanine amidase